MNTRKLTFIIILAGTCLALQISPRPPNIEFTSFLTFIVGLTEGTVLGIFFGGSVMLINGFISPWGFGGLNIPFQIAGMIIAGIVGGVYRKFTNHVSFSARFTLEPAILGAFIALAYDIITNLGFALYLVLAGENTSMAFATTIAYGSPFSVIHIVTNCAVFGILFLPITGALNRLNVGDTIWSKKEPLYS